MWAPHQFLGLDPKRVRDLPQHRDTGGDFRAFNGADVARAHVGPVGQRFLRHFLHMTQPTQIDRHDLLEIHGEDGDVIGNIVPGTIIPNRMGA